MHFLAYCYHWSPDVMWKMSSKERRKWVQKLIEQKEAEQEAYESKD